MSTNFVEILITLPFEEALVDRLNEVSPRLRITVHKARKPEDIPDEVWEKTEVLYTNTVLPEPEAVPNLRWVQLHWAGVDHAVDLPLLRKPDLAVTHLSGANATQLAEFVVMQLLSLGRHIPALNILQQAGEWPTNRWSKFKPHELRGSTVGIVGYGSVGRQIARLLAAFGATVLAAKRDCMHPEDQGYLVDGLGDPEGDYVHRLYPPQALRSMFKECDDVVVSVPLTPETRGLIGAQELEALPPGARLVDISRGGVVDHAALIEALESGHLAGAALDVYPQEPLPSDSPLWGIPNVILTPHIAGFSTLYDQRAVELFAKNLKRYLASQPLFNPFNPELGY